MANEIEAIKTGQAGYTSPNTAIYTPQQFTAPQVGQEGGVPETGDRYEPGAAQQDAGIYNPKMFQNNGANGTQAAGETKKTGEVSLEQAQEEFFQVIKEAKEKYGAKDILVEHFDKVKAANQEQGQGEKAAGANGAAGAAAAGAGAAANGANPSGGQKAGGMPPHIQVASSLMNESRFPPELQAKFQEKGNQLLQAWDRQGQNPQQAGEQQPGAQQPVAAAAGQDKKAQ